MKRERTDTTFKPSVYGMKVKETRGLNDKLKLINPIVRMPFFMAGGKAGLL
ncbi:hypothetical protein [Pedobacter jejuensis]|uniref:hypothetical protein n=1 Tax=Pedobacter jejuensis TaxID=1268550 RepID=UPI00142E85EF|nr:hypothetical protein [Pedobacter jejuensis]